MASWAKIPWASCGWCPPSLAGTWKEPQPEYQVERIKTSFHSMQDERWQRIQESREELAHPHQVKLSTLKIILICFFLLKEGVSKQKSMSLGSSPVGFKKLSTSHFRIPLHRHVQNIDQKSGEEDYY